MKVGVVQVSETIGALIDGDESAAWFHIYGIFVAGVGDPPRPISFIPSQLSTASVFSSRRKFR